MSYPRDLDDYSDAELAHELARRTLDREAGRCDYCHHPLGSKLSDFHLSTGHVVLGSDSCRYRERHFFGIADAGREVERGTAAK